MPSHAKFTVYLTPPPLTRV